MRNLFAFFFRYHVFFVFILLEITAVGMLIQTHHYQYSRFASSSNSWSGQILEQFNNISDYFSLKKINSLLAEENALIRNRSLQLRPLSENIYKNQHQYISAKIIKNSYNKRNNYLTINKGSMDGIENGMGVICEDGVVGIIRDVSPNFATVMSLLNKNTIISTRFMKSNHFGELVWDGKSHQFAQLNSVEKFVPVNIGDSLVTNSFSNIFPEGITLGTVNRFERDENKNFYTSIEVALSVDFSNLNYIYILKDELKEERMELESKNE